MRGTRLPAGGYSGVQQRIKEITKRVYINDEEQRMDETMNDPYYNAEYADTEFTEEKKFPWKIINWIIAVVLLPVCGMIIIIIGTSFISFGIAFAFVIALGVANSALRNHRTALNIFRAVTVFAVAAGFIPYVLLMKFDHSKMLYTVKKANYISGVKSNNESYISFLPEKLPEICDDYTFVTIGFLPIPDHVSKSYLIFTTDADTIDTFRDYYISLGCELRDIDADPDKDHSLSDYPDVKKEDFYYWFCSRANLDEAIQNDFEHNELYVKKDDEYEKYSKAVLLNRDKGLVVILV